jgi:hypothetical protein
MKYHNSQGFNNFRFPTEFWLICTIVGLGFVYGFNIGFYSFRMVDLILVLTIMYFIFRNKSKDNSKLILFYSLLVIYLFVLTVLDFENYSHLLYAKTQFGMLMTYLTPIIYIHVRETYIDISIAKKLLIIAFIISILSQFGILTWGESEASGVADLGLFLNLGTSMRKYGEIIKYQERTITIWRALIIGASFALIFVKTKPMWKIIGISSLFLQIAGGGGGRGGLVFVVVTPIIFFFLLNDDKKIKIIKKISVAFAISAFFASIYILAPLGQKYVTKDNILVTHQDRSEEILVLFTGGWDEASRIGGFNARTMGYEEYINRIFSDWFIFLFGVGLYKGVGFVYTANQGAHNMILDIWSLVGIIGLFFFIVFQYYILKDLINILRIKNISNNSKVMLYSFAIALIYFYTPLLFQAVTSDRSFMIVYYLIAGTLRPLSKSITEKKLEV